MSEKTEITFMQTKCAKRKDFGQGFYLTTSKEQAESFLRTSIVKAIATGTIEEGQKYGYISTFEFKLSENLETHIFENADVDWLHCIAAHRKKKMFIEVEREMARYDIIAGKIADDATNATLTAYNNSKGKNELYNRPSYHYGDR